MKLYFITGNAGKFEEAKGVIPELELLDIDLPEIQDIDPEMIITAKLEAAFEYHDGPFIVEDTSLSFDCLNGLPGPLVKWFIKSIGNRGLYDLANHYQNFGATASSHVGYAKNRDDIRFFRNSLRGTISSVAGSNGFGWDEIFTPEGHTKTFAEMTPNEYLPLRMRRKALEELAQAL